MIIGRILEAILGRLFHVHRWQYRDVRADDGTVASTRRCCGCPAREIWARDESGWAGGHWIPDARRSDDGTGGGGHASTRP